MNPLRQIEQEVLARGREWTRSQLEQQLQEIANALPAVCGQSGLPLKRTRWRSLQLDTVAGVLNLRVRHGYSPAQDRWVCPAREHWGLLPYGRKSPELQARLAYTATAVGSYADAEAMAGTWGTPVSDGCVFHQVKRLGEKAGGLELPMPTPLKAEPAFSLVVMMDGWMARERGADWGAGPRAKDPERVEWREIKSAVIYRLEQRVENANGRGMLLEKYAVATPPETSPLDFGAAVLAEARRRGMGSAQVVYVVMDGAVWLWALAEDRFQSAVKTLDFHHAREHLQAVGEALHGVGTEAAKAWLKATLHQLRHGQEARVVKNLEDLLNPATPTSRTTQDQATLTREVSYFKDHEDHLHYRRMEKAGAPMGSGAVESLGKQFQRRLRGCGQFWTRPGLTHLLQLCVLVKNKDGHLLWN